MPAEIISFRIGHCTAPERLTRRGAGWRPVQIPAGAILIRQPGAGDILFDTGYGSAFFEATQPFPERLYRWLTPATLPDGQRLPRHLAACGARPGLAILSHLHADHIAGLFDLPEVPPVLTSRAAWQHLHQGSRLKTLKAGCPEGLRQRLKALQPRFIEDHPQVAPPPGCEALGPFHDLTGDGALLAVPLPGHGHGQFGLWLPEATHHDKTGPAFLIADAAWSRQALRDRAPPPRSTLKRLGDADAYLATFTALADLMRARPEVSFWPSHCPEAFA